MSLICIALISAGAIASARGVYKAVKSEFQELDVIPWSFVGFGLATTGAVLARFL